jgi:hypothetical protein
VPTKRASAVALEAFTEATLAARRQPRRRVLLGLAPLALRDDRDDAVGLLVAHRDLAAAGRGRSRRWLALPPPDHGLTGAGCQWEPENTCSVLKCRRQLSRPQMGAVGSAWIARATASRALICWAVLTCSAVHRSWLPLPLGTSPGIQPLVTQKCSCR